MLSNDTQVDPIVCYARAAKLSNKAKEPFPVKTPFTCSLLWVTKFSMQSTCAYFSADQNGGLGEQIALNNSIWWRYVSISKSVLNQP